MSKRLTMAMLEDQIAELQAQLLRAEGACDELRADVAALTIANTQAVATNSRLKVENDALRAATTKGKP